MAEKDKCTECGLCRNACPVFTILKNETLSPRGKVMLLKEDMKDEIFFACTLCKSCTIACPISLDLDKDFRNHRAKLEECNKTTKANRLLIENVRKYGNPVGEVKEGEIPKELFCC